MKYLTGIRGIWRGHLKRFRLICIALGGKLRKETLLKLYDVMIVLLIAWTLKADQT